MSSAFVICRTDLCATEASPSYYYSSYRINGEEVACRRALRDFHISTSTFSSERHLPQSILIIMSFIIISSSIEELAPKSYIVLYFILRECSALKSNTEATVYCGHIWFSIIYMFTNIPAIGGSSRGHPSIKRNKTLLSCEPALKSHPAHRMPCIMYAICVHYLLPSLSFSVWLCSTYDPSYFRRV